MPAWKHIPQWVSRDSRVVRLDILERFVFLALWHVCDRWGRGDLDPYVLRLTLAVMDPSVDLSPAIARLMEVGLIETYVVDGHPYWAIHDYDTSGPPGVRTRRNPSDFPPPPVKGAKASDCSPDEIASILRGARVPGSTRRDSTGPDQKETKKKESETATPDSPLGVEVLSAMPVERPAPDDASSSRQDG